MMTAKLTATVKSVTCHVTRFPITQHLVQIPSLSSRLSNINLDQRQPRVVIDIKIRFVNKMWNNDDGYDSDDDGELEEEKTFKPAFVVIAVDTHPLMFKKNEDGSIPFRNCIEACYNLADSLIFTQNRSSWSQFAVVLAREDSPSLTEFQDNLIDTVKLLKERTKWPDKQLSDEYQRKGDFDLATFFLACKKVFHDIKSPFYKRTLIYITNDDEPVLDANKRFTALNEVKTFSGNQIDFQVVPMRLDFDYTKFYNELFSVMDCSPVEEICEDTEGLIEKLTSTVVKRYTQRKLPFYPFKGDTTRFLSCFKIDIIHATRLINVKMTKDGKSIKRVVVGDSQSSYFFKCKAPGRETIKFDTYEKNAILEHTLPLGLTLLYISKRSTDVGHVLGKPFLLQQDKKDELPYFEKFWQCCVDNERVLVCARKLKLADKLRYVELIPISVNGSPTFLAKNIPFSTEIVYPKSCDYPEQESTSQKKEAIRALVDALTFDFDLKMIPDPSYRKRQAYVKAKLLEEPMEEVNDVTLNAEVLDKHLKEAVDLINANYLLVEGKKEKPLLKLHKQKKQNKQVYSKFTLHLWFLICFFLCCIYFVCSKSNKTDYLFLMINVL
ncbi:hypothetical protein NQ314_003463 [Rhamnusium bicolor]|uniref:Ku70/Ku80 N-terminal alpha/beta domain-containing protein n=1 Tax=Rhamnusium bicolor TaxID=1586634 RepID=A0AAV8ZM11_9CUCU|nr:hypothetical protein NQ314_003463 [Rhamnusium bicolor]